MNLIIALDQSNHAQGYLFWDDGESVNTYQKQNYNYFYFRFQKQRLTIEPWTYKYLQMGYQIKLNQITIYGLQSQPAIIRYNQQHLPNNKWSFNSTSNVLQMNNLQLDFSQKNFFIFYI